MKKIIAILFLTMALIVVPSPIVQIAQAQADAGFMDSPWGSGYACFDVHHGNFAGFCAGWSSPKPSLPCDCSAY